MRLLPLALHSLINRRVTATLTVLSIAISVMLLLGVETVRTGARESFANTISGTDLIVGARGGEIQLLLSSVFHVGNATNEVSWESYQDIATLPEVAWTVPLSMGDSHQGYRVIGTTPAYFTQYRYGRKQHLTFASGAAFSEVYEAVLGASVAEELGYAIGVELELTHGLDVHDTGLARHEERPFRVTGILTRTGTPVDRAVHIRLQGLEAVHADWLGGVHLPGEAPGHETQEHVHHDPDTVTAVLVGLTSRRAAVGVRRAINAYRGEPLSAILPGVALQQLWDAMGTAEAALRAISILVVASGLLGMVTMTLAGLNERRREMAILRSVGARPGHILGLLVLEAGALATVGAVAGLAGRYLALEVARSWVTARFGLRLPIALPNGWEWGILCVVVAVGFLAGLVPAYRGYRYSLADGMIVHT